MPVELIDTLLHFEEGTIGASLPCSPWWDVIWIQAAVLPANTVL